MYTADWLGAGNSLQVSQLPGASPAKLLGSEIQNQRQASNPGTLKWVPLGQTPAPHALIYKYGREMNA